MFIQQAFRSDNKFWKYIVGSLMVILASFLGQIPLTIAILAKAMGKGGQMPESQSEMLRYLDLNLTLFLLLLSFAAAFWALIIVVRKFHNQEFRGVVTSRSKIDIRRILFSFAIWAVFSASTIVIDYYVNPQDYIVQFDLARFLVLLIIAVVMIPVQTSVEELMFRGYLMQGFGILSKNRWFPLLITSLIFGGLHIFNPEVEKMGYIISIYYVGTGLMLGIVTLMDDGTELALGFHAANNLIAALLVTADWTAFQTNSVFRDISEPTAGFDVLLPVLIIYPLLLLIFSWRYKWSGWKEKLTGKLEDIKPNTVNNG